MDLNALEDFLLVANHGGFGKASRASGRSKATLSRRVADLEEALGVRLIERGTRSLQLSEAGQLLVARTGGPLREIEEAVSAVRDGLATPRGRLRIAAPLLFSQIALGRIAAAFQALYPEVQIDAVSEDRLSDLVDEHFDVAIRINPPPENTLVGRCFARDRLLLVSAPSLPMPAPEISHSPPPSVPAVVMLTHVDGAIWSVRNGAFVVQPRPMLRLSSLLTVRDAVAAGAGAAMLPQSIIGDLLEKGELVTWGEADARIELWVLHTSRRLQSPKVRAFVDFICDQYPGGAFTAPDR